MNAFVPLLILYCLITAGSASILFFSFKGKVDVSGHYFLVSELTMFAAIALIILTNLNFNLITPIVLFFGNVLYGVAELAIFFSIYAIARKNNVFFTFLMVALVVTYSIVMEILRLNVNPNLPFLIVPLIISIFQFGTFYIYRYITDKELRSNPFLKWICYLEFILGCISIVRALSFFTSEVIVQRQPPLLSVLIYTLVITLSIFRYFAYQSFRMTWAKPLTHPKNFLNENLVRALEEKNQLLEKLSKSNRMIGMGALASSLAHQLSQPLTAVNLKIEILKRHIDKLGSPTRIHDLAEEINIQLKSLTELVINLRYLFGNQPNNFKKVELKEISDAILKIIEPTIQSNKINFIKTYKDSPIVLGDAIQLQQILVNLFNNAIEAVNSNQNNNKNIELEISQIGLMAKIVIKDNGPGIDQHNLSTLFELYKTTKKEGMGLGLWLSKIIIQRHQGDIRVEIQPNGTHFVIEIPITD